MPGVYFRRYFSHHLKEKIILIRKFQLKWGIVGFAFSLIFPSTAIFYKYFDIPGVLFYILLAGLGLWIIHRYRFDILNRISDRGVTILSVLVFIALTAIFLLIYPVADSGIVGRGSDNDDALTIAAQQLLAGHYPYEVRTYLGNPISPLPGAIILSLPFVLLGNVGYQNIFWLAVFLFFSMRYFGDRCVALLLFLIVIIFSPVILYLVVIGSDYISNSIYVLVFSVWMISSVLNPRDPVWVKLVLAIFLGIALSSRANFLFLLPLIYMLILRRSNFKTASFYLGITGLAFVLTTLPFYLWSPENFSPLHTADKLVQLDEFIPYAGSLVLISTLIFTIWLSLKMIKSPDTYLYYFFLILAFPIVLGGFISIFIPGDHFIGFAFYGVFFIFFGVLAFWKDFIHNGNQTTGYVWS